MQLNFGKAITILCILVLSVTVPLSGVNGSAIDLSSTRITNVSGIIHNDTIWTKDGSPYQLDGNVQIDSGATLSIQPGVRVEGNGYKLQAWGQLRAIGSPEEPVQFNNVHIGGGINNAASDPFVLHIQHAVLQGGSLYQPTGNATYGSLQLLDSQLYSLTDSIHLWYPVADCVIERNVFYQTPDINAGIKDHVHVNIRNNVFTDWLGDSSNNGAMIVNWAAYDTAEMVVEKNSFLSIQIAVALPRGYSNAKMTAVNNYWGTENPDIIKSMVLDRDDDLERASSIAYNPYLTSPDPATPVFVRPAPTAVPTSEPTSTSVAIPTSTFVPTTSQQPGPTGTGFPTPTETPQIEPTQANSLWNQILIPVVLHPGIASKPTVQPTIIPTAKPSKPVEILENYTTYVDSIQYLHIVGEVANHTDHHLRYVKINAYFYDAAGRYINNKFTFTLMNVLPPYDQSCFDLSLPIPDDYAYFRFEPVEYLDGSPLPALTQINTRGSYDPTYGWYTIRGLIKNDSASQVRYVKPVGTLYNSSNQVIGCDFTFVDGTHLDPGQSKAYEMIFLGRNYSDATSYRIQVSGN